jgi:hypothetical protein
MLRKVRLTFLLCSLGAIAGSWADSDLDRLKDARGGAVSLPSSPPAPVEPKNKPDIHRFPDCAYPTRDWRCQPHPNNPYNRRPVIVNQINTTPPVETTNLRDDWDGCRTAKLGAIRARDSGDLDRANNLDEWLWKNCRSYSVELRQLEQDGM